MKVLVLAVCVAAVFGASCQPVKCGTTQTFNSGECWLYDVNSYYLKQCQHPLKCSALDSSVASGSVGTCGPPNPFAADGEVCFGTTDCMTTSATAASVTCTAGKCTGYLGSGATCTITTDCQAGFYCNSSFVCTAVSNTGVCVNLASPGTSSCTNDHTCIAGACVALGSAAGGADCTWDGDCMSFFCDPDQKKCAYAAPVSGNPAPHTCDPSSGTDCISKSYKNWQNQNETLDAGCECGYSFSGNAYCNQLVGDPDAQKYIALAQQWASSSNFSKCNPLTKWSYNCVRTYEDQHFWESFIYYYARTFTFPKIAGTDTCGAIIFAEDYEEANAYLNGGNHDDVDDDDDDFAGILAIIGAVMLF